MDGKQLSRRAFLNCLCSSDCAVPSHPSVSTGTLIQYCREELSRIIDDILWTDEDVFNKVTRPLFINNIPHRIHAELFLWRLKRPRIAALRKRLHQAMSFVQNNFDTSPSSETLAFEVVVFAALSVVFFIDRHCPLQLQAFSSLRRFCQKFNDTTEIFPSSVFLEDGVDVLDRPWWANWWNISTWEPTEEVVVDAPLSPIWQRIGFLSVALSMVAVSLATGNIPEMLRQALGTKKDDYDE